MEYELAPDIIPSDVMMASLTQKGNLFTEVLICKLFCIAVIIGTPQMK